MTRRPPLSLSALRCQRSRRGPRRHPQWRTRQRRAPVGRAATLQQRTVLGRCKKTSTSLSLAGCGRERGREEGLAVGGRPPPPPRRSAPHATRLWWKRGSCLTAAGQRGGGTAPGRAGGGGHCHEPTAVSARGGGSSPPRGGGRGRARVGGWGGGMSKCMPPPRRLPGNDRTAAAWQGPLMESRPASTRSGRAIRPPLTMG